MYCYMMIGVMYLYSQGCVSLYLYWLSLFALPSHITTPIRIGHVCTLKVILLPSTNYNSQTAGAVSCCVDNQLEGR